LLVFAIPVLAIGARYVEAAAPVHITGGGTGTFLADLDLDGDIDGSQFGFAVVLLGGSAQGHFECLMAGRSDILGLGLMAVEAKITDGWVNGGSATFSGTATILLTRSTLPGVPEGKFTEVPIVVIVTPGGPGVGTLQLTVLGLFDGAPGDTNPGNGDYDLAVETVASGGIKVH
jgi:hypothetical protein